MPAHLDRTGSTLSNLTVRRLHIWSILLGARLQFQMGPNGFAKRGRVVCIAQTGTNSECESDHVEFLLSLHIQKESMSNRSKAQVLVVDDEPGVRESLGMLLMSAGYDVATADNGVAAVAHLSSTIPDLIITDLNMRYMSGVELIAYVRTCHPSIPIVAMSGGYQADAVPASLIADRFYPKGQHPHHLLTTIASLIATSPACGSVARPLLDS